MPFDLIAYLYPGKNLAQIWQGFNLQVCRDPPQKDEKSLIVVGKNQNMTGFAGEKNH